MMSDYLCRSTMDTLTVPQRTKLSIFNFTKEGKKMLEIGFELKWSHFKVCSRSIKFPLGFPFSNLMENRSIL